MILADIVFITDTSSWYLVWCEWASKKWTSQLCTCTVPTPHCSGSAPCSLSNTAPSQHSVWRSIVQWLNRWAVTINIWKSSSEYILLQYMNDMEHELNDEYIVHNTYRCMLTLW